MRSTLKPGHNKGQRKLNSDLIFKLKQDRAAGMTYKDLGIKYNVSMVTAYNYCK